MPAYERAAPCDSVTRSAPSPSRSCCVTATSSQVVSGTRMARSSAKSVTVKGEKPSAAAGATSSAAATAWSSAAASGTTRWPAMVWSLR